ncbi:MAG: ABC transporter permease [Planctomycetes bacterium]|nr:ABC transporter permease [Planctomycetota bacterium]
MLGVLGLFVSMTLLSGLGVGIDSFSGASVEFATSQVGRADAIVAPGGGVADARPVFLADPVLSRVEGVPGVAGASPRFVLPFGWLLPVALEGESAIPDEDSGRSGKKREAQVVVYGLDLERERVLGLGGFLPDPELDAGEIAISRRAADAIGAREGDTVRLSLLPPSAGGLSGVAHALLGEHDLVVSCVLEEQDLFESWRRDYAVLPIDALVRTVYDDLARLLALFRQGALGEDEERRLREGIESLGALFSERPGPDGTDFDPEGGAPPDAGWLARIAEETEAARAAERPPRIATEVAVAFKDREELYDSRDLPGSVLALRRVGEEIRAETGLSYHVFLPRAEILLAIQSMAPLLTSAFLLIGVLLLAISGLLIHSLLSISVEEKARDFAILRTLGVRRAFLFRLVLSEALLIGTAGVALGLTAGVGVATVGFALLTRHADLVLHAFVRPWTLALAAGLGLASVVASALVPALRCSGARIVEGLRVYKFQDLVPRRVEGRGVPWRLAGSGFVLTVLVGATIWAVVALATSGDPSTAALVIGGLVLTLLVGLTLSAQAAQPFLERAVLAAGRPILPIEAGLASQNLRRFRRRNTGTALLFTLSVSVVSLVGSVWTLQAGQIVSLARFLNGSDIRIWIRDGWRPNRQAPAPLGDALREEFGDQIEAVSRARTAGDEDVRFSATVSDRVGLESVWVECQGIDGELGRALYEEESSFDEGSFEDLARMARGPPPLSIEPGLETSEPLHRRVVLHPDEGEMAISAGLAARLSVSRGDRLLLTVRRGRIERQKVFRVTAVIRRLPGFRNVRASESGAFGSTVLVSEAEFGTGRLFGPFGSRSSWFVKLRGDEELGDRIEEKLGERYPFHLRETSREVRRAKGWIVKGQLVLSFVLSLVVVLSFFSLLGSLYSTVLERVRELAILKSLGMRRRRILGSLALEAVALMSGSGLLGAVAGFVLAYLVVRLIHDRMSELPTTFEFPWVLTASVLAWSLVLGAAGAWLAARRLLKKPAAELFGKAG